MHVPQPAACARLIAVNLPPGTTGQDAIEEQAKVILEYEAQIKACAKQ